MTSEFTRIPLDCPVSAWYPIDINNDSLWELATTCSGTPTRIGIFSPQTGEWLDGPHPVRAVGRSWGAGDYDGDGILEYAYLRSDTIRLNDPAAGLDSALWIAPFVPEEGIFWGMSATGHPLVGLKQGIYYNHVSHCFDPNFDCMVEHSERWSIHVYELFTGSEIRQVPAGPNPWRVISGLLSSGEDRLVLHHHEYTSLDFLMIHTRGHVDTLLSIDPRWAYERLMGFVTPQEDSFGIPTSARSVAQVSAVRAGFPPQTLVLVDLGWGPGPPPWAKTVCRNLELNATTWERSHYSTSDYPSLAAYDLNSDGQPALYLPLNSGAGWEVRSLSNGAIQDTLPGMPKADLQTGPLTLAGHQDLFYIADSSLYIWGLPTSVNDDQTHTTGLPATPWLTAHPNPFNGNVHLDWSPGSGATALDIYNILGQRIRSYDLAAASGSHTSVEWDGTDNGGHSVPSGLYFARLSSNARQVATKLVLLK